MLFEIDNRIKLVISYLSYLVIVAAARPGAVDKENLVHIPDSLNHRAVRCCHCHQQLVSQKKRSLVYCVFGLLVY